MTIGFDASRAFGSELGGTENYSRELLRALVKIDRKNKYVVYTRGVVDDPLLSKLEARPNVWIRPICWPRLWTQGGLALGTYRDKLDVLFVPAHTLPVLRKPSLPTVVTIHGLEYEYLPEHYKIPQKYYLTWSTRYAVRHASKLIAVSKFTKRELVKRIGASSSRIAVVHEGVDAAFFNKSFKKAYKRKVLETYSIVKPYVLFVGVVQPRKNLVRLIKAFSELIKRQSKITTKERVAWFNSRSRIRARDFGSLGGGGSGNVKLDRRSSPRFHGLAELSLVIAGKLGWMYKEVLEAPGKYGVEDRVKFVGFVAKEHLPVLLQEAIVYVQPSLTEGFGLPVLEAMAAGTPVVAAKAGALTEVVGEAGLLVDPTKPAEIANAMSLVLNSRELGEGLRERGYFRVKQFSWKKTAKETLKLIESVGYSQKI